MDLSYSNKTILPVIFLGDNAVMNKLNSITIYKDESLYHVNNEVEFY